MCSNDRPVQGKMCIKHKYLKMIHIKETLNERFFIFMDYFDFWISNITNALLLP